MPAQELLHPVLYIVNASLGCRSCKIVHIIHRHSSSESLVQIDERSITSLLLVCHLLRAVQHLYANLVQRDITFLLCFLQPVEPHLLADNQGVYANCILNIWFNVYVAKADITQFTVMVNAEQATSWNEETTERMIVTLISRRRFATIEPRHPSSR